MSAGSEVLKIEGPLTFASLPLILDETRDFASRPDLPDALAIDLSAIAEVDSSAVALLLKWRREARRLGKRLEFTNIPVNLAALAELYDVTEFVQATAAR
jgi:phospholipid transport system transporter-binding protein